MRIGSGLPTTGIVYTLQSLDRLSGHAGAYALGGRQYRKKKRKKAPVAPQGNSPANVKSREKTEDSEPEDRPEEYDNMRTLKVPPMNFDVRYSVGVWGLAIALVAATTYVYQWRAQLAANGLIQKQMIHDQQPWLKLEVGKTVDNPSGNMTVNIVIGGTLTVPVTLTNVGKTPARKVITLLFIEIVPTGQDPHLPTHRGETITGVPYFGGVLFPSDVHNVPAIRLVESPEGTPRQEQPLTRSEAQSLSERKSYLAVWGSVHYCDIFGILHKTDMCEATFTSGENAGSEKCTKFSDTDTDDNDEKCPKNPN
jgi:hypothetical protein